MKYIKSIFESNNSLYKEVTMEELFEFCNKYKGAYLGDKDIKDLKDFLHKFNILDSEITSLRKGLSIVRKEDISYSKVVNDWLQGRYDYSSLNNRDCVIDHEVVKFDDDWYIVYDKTPKMDEVRYYKCDQIQGVFKYFEDYFSLETNVYKGRLLDRFKKFINR